MIQRLAPVDCLVPRGRRRTPTDPQVRGVDEVEGGPKPELLPSPSIQLYLSATEKPHPNDFIHFAKPNVNFKSLFLFPLTAAFHSAAGQRMTCGEGQRFSRDFTVQTLIRRAGAALPTSRRRCLLRRDADRILRGSFTESRGWESV